MNNLLTNHPNKEHVGRKVIIVYTNKKES